MSTRHFSPNIFIDNNLACAQYFFCLTLAALWVLQTADI